MTEFPPFTEYAEIAAYNFALTKIAEWMREHNTSVKGFRERIEREYRNAPTGCGGSFGEILCYEIHDGMTFMELAQRWGVSVSFLGWVIADHCEKMENAKNYKPLFSTDAELDELIKSGDENN